VLPKAVPPAADWKFQYPRFSRLELPGRLCRTSLVERLITIAEVAGVSFSYQALCHRGKLTSSRLRSISFRNRHGVYVKCANLTENQGRMKPYIEIKEAAMSWNPDQLGFQTHGFFFVFWDDTLDLFRQPSLDEGVGTRRNGPGPDDDEASELYGNGPLILTMTSRRVNLIVQTLSSRLCRIVMVGVNLCKSWTRPKGQNFSHRVTQLPSMDLCGLIYNTGRTARHSSGLNIAMDI
jgi:hypothetical protein